MQKEELLKRLDEEQLDKVREVTKNFEQSFVAVGQDTDDEEKIRIVIVGSCSPDFIAEVIDSVLSDNPKVLAALAAKKLSKTMNLNVLDKMVDGLMENLEASHKPQEGKKIIH